MRKTARRSIPICIVGLIASLGPAWGAACDVIETPDGRIEDADIQAVRGGVFFYLDADGSLGRASVGDVVSIRFEGLHETAAAERYLDRGELVEALEKFQVALIDADSEPERLWIRARLAHVHDELGDYVEAAGHAAAVINIDPAPAWTHLRPETPFDPATAEVSFYAAAEAHHHLIRAERRADDPEVRAMVESMMSRVRPVWERVQAASPDMRYRAGSTISGFLIRDIGTERARKDRPERPVQVEDGGRDGVTAPPEDPQAPEEAPSSPIGRDAGPDSPAAIQAMIDAGRHRQAVEICERLARDPGERDLAQFVYQYGLALAGAGRPEDAAVQFMRAALHFPGSRFAPLGLIETARVYRDVYEDEETARRLLQDAAARAEALDEPEIAQRARELLR